MTDEQVPDLSTVESPPRRTDIEYGMVKNGELIGSGGQAVVRRTSLPGRDPPDTVAVKEPQAPRKQSQKRLSNHSSKKPLPGRS